MGFKAALMAAWLCCFMSSAHAADMKLQQWTLDNGMRVLLLPNEHQQAVSHRIWFGVGAADDPADRTGLAHFVEHMMFSGTPNYPDLAYSTTISSLGGQENAFTSWDYTAYHAMIAKEHLPKLMELEADRLQHVQLSDALVARERNVILEERASRVDLSPESKLREQLRQHFWSRHPYCRPIIGWNEDIKAISLEDLQRFYRRYMHASNMTLVVAGNISRAELEPMVEGYYGALPRRDVPKRTWLNEPVMPATTSTVNMHDATVRQPVMSMMFPIASMHEVSAEVAMGYYMVAHILGGGQSSLLHKALVEDQQLAVSVGAYADPAIVGKAALTLRIVPRAGVEPQALEDAVLALLGTIEISQEALDSAKDMLLAEKIYALDGTDGLARWVGEWVSAGLDVALLQDWDGWLSRTNIDHVRQAMKAVQKPPVVIGWLLPAKGEADE